MNRPLITFISASGFLAILALNSTASAQGDLAQRLAARAEAAAKTIQDACSPDVTKFCSQVTPGEGRLVLCMMAHEDKVSDKCDHALYSAARNIERAIDRIEETADACWPDIEKQCSETVPGGGRVAQCLIGKKASLSKECAATIDKFSAKK
jgi:hypothetical protein